VVVATVAANNAAKAIFISETLPADQRADHASHFA
jgi:hypothetical protein